ncbi:MAG: HAMP domain-containing protein [bacterium]|nr:HAMP domain-containing protein [bacterium]
MTISRKIFGLASIFAFVLVTVGTYALSRMAQLSKDVQFVSAQVTTLNETSGTLNRVAAGQLRQILEFERAMSAATGRGHGPSQEARYGTARQRFESLGAAVEGLIQKGEGEIQAAMLRPLPAEERKKLSLLSDRLLDLGVEQRAFSEKASVIFSEVDEGAISVAVAHAAGLSPGAATFDLELASLAADIRAHTGEALTESQRGVAASRAGMLLLVGFGTMFSLIGWALMARSVVAPLHEVGLIAEAVATGKTDVRFPTEVRDETGRVFDAVRQLSDAVLAAEQRTDDKAKDLEGALARVAEQNRRLHALERELVEARQQTGSVGPREIIGNQRHTDT